MAIQAGYKHNFETLIQAVTNGDVCLLECTDAVTGQAVIAVCAVNRDGEEVALVPLARLFDDDPYAGLVPPGGD